MLSQIHIQRGAFHTHIHTHTGWPLPTEFEWKWCWLSERTSVRSLCVCFEYRGRFDMIRTAGAFATFKTIIIHRHQHHWHHLGNTQQPNSISIDVGTTCCKSVVEPTSVHSHCASSPSRTRFYRNPARKSSADLWQFSLSLLALWNWSSQSRYKVCIINR